MSGKYQSLRMYTLSVCFMVFFVLVSIISLQVVKYRILNNSQIMGQAIAARFADKELAKIQMQELVLKSTAGSLERLFAINPHISGSEVEKILWQYTQELRNSGSDSYFDMCAVVDGELVGTSAWKQSARRENLKWYQQALLHPDEIVYTNLYTLGERGERALTLALSVGGSGNVVALNIYPQVLHDQLSRMLPEHSFYYLCDADGSLLYAVGNRNKSISELQPYVDHVVEEINEGFTENDPFFIYDLDGNQRGVYYTVSDKGWLTIITLPYDYIFQDYSGLLKWFVITLAAFVLFAAIMYLRVTQRDKVLEAANETVRALGNSYYSIYRVNFNSGLYTRIKGVDKVAEQTAERGDYRQLLQKMLEFVEPEAEKDFAETFSLASIRKLVAGKMRDFGGDFKQRFDGGYKWVNVRLLFDESLNSGEVILGFKEVDGEKRLQLEHMQLTEAALKAIKKTTASKNMFFSSMSHDMRTPLNGIIGLSELAAKHVAEPDKMAEYLQKINGSSKQLLALINDVLEMSRLEYGKLETNEQAFDLRRGLAELVAPFELQAKNEGKDFRLQIDIEHECVCSDLQRISQILNNIISNAFKYTPAGSIVFSVRELPRKELLQYQFVVEDTGVGMTEEFLQKIFLPFERDMRFGAKNVLGTGLGMAIVKNLVTLMNGDIAITSQPGRGTRVTVTMPLRSAQNVCGSQKQEDDAAVLERLRGCQLLVAEDNEINMEIVTELLEMQGLKVIQAWNGREAVEKFAASAEGEIRLILMDMQMPELSGCEASREIRSLKRADAAGVPIIAVTANAFAEDISATTAAGMNAHISKPIDFKTLIKTISEYVK